MSAPDLEALKQAMSGRNYSKAEDLLGEALKKDPTSAELLASLGRVLFLDGKYARSAEQLEEAENHGQLDEQEHFTLSMADVILRRYAAAQLEVAGIVRENPRNPLYHYWLSRVHYAQFHLEAAVSEAHKAIQLDAGFTRGHEQLGLCYEASGQNDLAIQSYRVAVQLNQSARKPAARPLVDLGALLYKLNRLPEAEADFRQALNYEPRFSQAHFQLGILLEKEGKVPEATEHFRQAVAFDPSSPDAHFALGRALERTGHQDEARAEFAAFEKLKQAEPAKEVR